jgi:hypothetical protein
MFIACHFVSRQPFLARQKQITDLTWHSKTLECKSHEHLPSKKE